MAKKIVFTVSVVLLLTCIGITPLMAAEMSYDWQDKLSRGAVNTLTCFVEIPETVHATSNEKNLFVGWTVGLISGIGKTGVRLGVGLIDVLTCPFDFPVEGMGPIIEPEFAWEKV